MFNIALQVPSVSRVGLEALAFNYKYEFSRNKISRLLVGMTVNRDCGTFFQFKQTEGAFCPPDQSFHLYPFNQFLIISVFDPLQGILESIDGDVRHPDDFAADLGRVLLKLEELQEEQIRRAVEPKEKKVTVEGEEQAAALELLKDPKLLERILADFERCGVVGEETNKLTGYLAAISRKLGAIQSEALNVATTPS